MSLEKQGAPVKDNGPQWTPVQTHTASSDMSTAAAISAAPSSGEKVVADDVLISVGAALTITLQEETTDTVLAKFFMAANTSVLLSLRNGLRVPTLGKKLFGKASGAGNVAFTVSQHSEA